MHEMKQQQYADLPVNMGIEVPCYTLESDYFMDICLSSRFAQVTDSSSGGQVALEPFRGGNFSAFIYSQDTLSLIHH